MAVALLSRARWYSYDSRDSPMYSYRGYFKIYTPGRDKDIILCIANNKASACARTRDTLMRTILIEIPRRDSIRKF
jgi:hypothetical protein